MDFETGLSGWNRAGDSHELYTTGSSITNSYSGKASGHIKSEKDSIDGFGTLYQKVPVGSYRDQRLRMSAYVKTKDVQELAGLYMRVDVDTEHSALDNMDDRPILGDTDWTRYEIVLDVPENCTYIAFGIRLRGTGQVWVDDFQFEIVRLAEIEKGITWMYQTLGDSVKCFL